MRRLSGRSLDFRSPFPVPRFHGDMLHGDMLHGIWLARDDEERRRNDAPREMKLIVCSERLSRSVFDRAAAAR